MFVSYNLPVPNCPYCGSDEVDVISDSSRSIDDKHDRVILTCTCFDCRNDFKVLFDIRSAVKPLS